MHYYQFNIGDYIKQTIHLSPMEDLAYRRLLDFYYETELPIPNNIPLIARKLRIDVETISIILNEFFNLCDDKFVNTRADREIAEYHAFLDKQKANGSKGGRPKKPTANPTLTQHEPKITLNTNHKPLNTKHKPLTNKPIDDDFELFWKDYPKKVGKEAARKSWNINKPPIDLVLDSLRWQKRTTQWSKNDGQYIPNPTTWINQGRWQDELQEDSADAWINSTSQFNLLAEKEITNDRPRETKLLEHD